MDPETVKQNERDLFATGDYSFWSRMFEPISEALVEAARVSAGNRVLDVAAGNGNTALSAARRGAIVTALDISPAQIERGRSRARMEGQALAWVEGQGERLPFADESFDCALDSFGDILDNSWGEVGVREMLRVVRSGGTIGIAQWTDEGFEGGLAELQASFRGGVGEPPPLWGQEDYVRAALGPHAEYVVVRHKVIPAWFASVDSFTDELLQKDPYLQDFHLELTPEQWTGFCEELLRLATQWNTAIDGRLRLELIYLQTVAHKRDIIEAKPRR